MSNSERHKEKRKIRAKEKAKLNTINRPPRRPIGERGQ